MGNSKDPLVRQQRAFLAAHSTVSELVYVFDGECRFFHANQALLDLLGFALDDLIGRSLREVLESADLADDMERQIQSVLRTGETTSATTPYTSPTGIAGVYEYTLRRYEVDTGFRISGTARDVSQSTQLDGEPAQTNDELTHLLESITDEFYTVKADEQRYRTLTNAMPQMVWLADAHGNVLYFNDRWYEYTGLSEAESRDRGFTAALHPDDINLCLELWERAYRTGQRFQCECRYYSPERNQYRWFLARAFPVRDEDDVIVEWVGTSTDIEQQKVVERKLVESEQRLERAQRIARIGSWELDLGSEVLSFSEQYAHIFGLEADQLNPDLNYFHERVHPDDRAMVDEQLERLFTAGSGSSDMEYRIVLPNGEERVLHTLSELIADAEGNSLRISGTVHDITDRKEIDAALEENARQQAALSRELQDLNSTLEEQVERRTSELRQLTDNLERLVWERTEELEARSAELAHRAQHDSLTGLPNRTLFDDRLERAIASADRNGKKVAVLFVDLDGFKLVNDSFGHAAGDVVLQEIATRLSEVMRRSDTLSRHGGDEFAILLEGIEHPEDAHAVARSFLAAIGQPFTITGRSVRLSASIGISLYPQDAWTVVDLQRHADAAMYRAKMAGKNDIRFYSPAMNAAAEERLEIASHLTTVLERGELSLYFQPQWNAGADRIEWFEALLRWEHPELGNVSPDRLIPVAEEIGLMTEIGAWVLDESCRQAARWNEMTGQRIGVAVNISPTQLDRSDFVEVVERTLRKHQILPAQLELELTEDAVTGDLHGVSRGLAELRELGVRIAMDDFGLGSSSLSNLVHLPLDTVKIDRVFIRDLPENDAADRIVEAIVALTSGIRLDVVAEGVETEAQRRRVVDLGCRRLQGFLLGRPVPAHEVDALLQNYTVRSYPTG